MRNTAAHERRARRALMPRVLRQATILLETADFDLAAAVAAVLLAYEAHEQEAA